MTPLDLVLDPIRRAILDLRRLMPSVRAATVTSVNPLRIQMDGPNEAPLSESPTTLVPVGPGDRVRVLHYGTTHLVLGAVSPGIAWKNLTVASGLTGTVQYSSSGRAVEMRIDVSGNMGGDTLITSNSVPPSLRPSGQFPTGPGMGDPAASRREVLLYVETSGQLRVSTPAGTTRARGSLLWLAR